MPYCCQSRNHGMLACISSCLLFAAERSLGVKGLLSGTASMRSSHSISAMVCSTSIDASIADQLATQNWEQRAYDSQAAPTMEPRQRAWVFGCLDGKSANREVN